MGRKADPTRLPKGEAPVAPSAVRSTPQKGGANACFEFGLPYVPETEEVAGFVGEFRHGAEQARKAGMDGVEIHAANGYLIGQFLKDATNRRTDRCGGGVANRAQFLLEVADAAIGVFGAGRVGVRVSPHCRDGGIGDSDTESLFRHVASALDDLHIAYLPVIEATVVGARHLDEGPALRQAFPAFDDLVCDPVRTY